MQYIKSIQTTFAHIALSVVLTESEKLYFITIFKSQTIIDRINSLGI